MLNSTLLSCHLPYICSPLLQTISSHSQSSSPLSEWCHHGLSTGDKKKETILSSHKPHTRTCTHTHKERCVCPDTMIMAKVSQRLTTPRPVLCSREPYFEICPCNTASEYHMYRLYTINICRIYTSLALQGLSEKYPRSLWCSQVPQWPPSAPVQVATCSHETFPDNN